MNDTCMVALCSQHAGMRELWQTGWMQQTMRMVTAAFLTEYLNRSWTDGAAWFHDTLVDADLAINSMMWQNAGKSGLDQWNFTLLPTSKSQVCHKCTGAATVTELVLIADGTACVAYLGRLQAGLVGCSRAAENQSGSRGCGDGLAWAFGVFVTLAR
eukprot:GHUV01043435.1.p1 GENE.GHUV01043435.1~~GHUV01043435.1.p1  ORF type:complete len:157 (+),score=38.03 GHUV01043435.1:265-735(+)